MTLNRNVDNFFAETEQVAFLPSNVIPGIDFTQRPAAAGPPVLVPRHAEVAPRHDQFPPDSDQRAEVPVPQLPARRPDADAGTHRARQLRAQQPGRGRRGRRPARMPRDRLLQLRQRTASATIATREAARARRRCSPITTARRACSIRSQTEIEQAHIASAFVFELSKVALAARAQARCSRSLRNVDEKLAKRVADGLAMPLPPKATGGARAGRRWSRRRRCRSSGTRRRRWSAARSASCSPRARTTPRSRRVKKAATAAGATVVLIAPKVGGIPVKGGTLKADGQLAGTPSVLFDAIALVLTTQAAKKLCQRWRRGPVRHGCVRAPEGHRAQ